MNTIVLGFLSGPEIFAIMIVVLIMFGSKKVPEFAKGLGQGIREFKKHSRDVQDEVQRAIDTEPSPPPPPAPRPPAQPAQPAAKPDAATNPVQKA
jgi:sec-independent protein translocase protein TatA